MTWPGVLTGWHLALTELVAFLETRQVARFKLPERLVVLAAFPLASVGKINITALREQMAQQFDEEESNGH